DDNKCPQRQWSILCFEWKILSAFDVSLLRAKIGRRSLIDRLEHARKIKRIFIAERYRHFFHAPRRFRKQPARVVHAKFDQIINRAAAGDALELSKIMGQRHVRNSSEGSCA